MIASFFIDFFLTAIIEMFAIYFFGYKKFRDLLFVFFLNLITNSALTYIIYFNRQYDHFSEIPLVIILEILIVIIEWRLMVWFWQENVKKLFLISFVLNASSLVVGWLMFFFL